jgi:hypothetical protein
MVLGFLDFVNNFNVYKTLYDGVGGFIQRNFS